MGTTMPSTDEFAIEASRAEEPYFYRAPYAENADGFTPMEFQYAGAEYILARNHGLLGDAPGLGKTLQAIMVSNAIEAKHTLVICPASLRLNWEREIWRWSTQTNVSTYPIMKAKDGVSLEAEWVITSYDMLRNKNIHAALMDQRWDHVILDEAHAIKDPKGNLRTKAICGWNHKGEYVPGLVDVAGRITLASGTILPNQPIECYNAVRMLNWNAIDEISLEDFKEYYYDFGKGFINVFDRATGKWKTKFTNKVRNQPRNLDDLQYRLRKHIMVRRLKEQVLTQLPKKQWHVFPLEATAAIRDALKHPGWQKAEKLWQLDPDAFDTSLPIDGAISTARNLLGDAMAPDVANYIDDLIESGVEKVIVAAWHHTVLDYLRKELAPHGLVYMDGRMSTVKKQAVVDLFQTDPRVKIILGQMIPLGVGWTLTAAQDAVLAEIDFVPGNNDQFVDRIHRMGQKGDHVLAHVPFVPGTLAEKIMGRVVEKSQHIHLALDA